MSTLYRVCPTIVLDPSRPRETTQLPEFLLLAESESDAIKQADRITGCDRSPIARSYFIGKVLP